MKTRDSVIIAAIAVAVVLAASFAVLGGGHDQDGFVIIHTNDTHCYYGDDGNLGFSTVASLKDQMESDGKTVFVLDAGDFLQGSVYGALSKGAYSVKVMNLVGYDLGVPGNHDFDFKYDELLNRADELDYPLICANLIYKSTGESVFPEYKILEKGGYKLGCFGLLTPDSEKTVMHGNLGDMTVTDPVAAAERMVDTLQHSDVDYIVAVGHIGVDRSSTITSDAICSQVSGIDIFVDGHSHTEMEDGKVCDGTIELIPSNTIITSTGCYNKTVGIIDVSGNGDISAKLHRDTIYHDTEIDGEVAKIHADVDEELSKVIGSTEIFLDGERGSVRVHETNLGDLVADAIRQEAGADVAIISGGSIRTSIPIGDITKRQALDVNPFFNSLFMMEISGKTLRDVMESSYSHYGEVSGGFLQISGITLKFDPSKDVGSRIVSLQKDGKEIGDNDKLKLATTDYLAKGGDGYSMLADLPYDVVGDLPAAMAGYLESLGDITESTIKMGRQTSVRQDLPGNPAQRAPIGRSHLPETTEHPLEDALEAVLQGPDDAARAADHLAGGVGHDERHGLLPCGYGIWQHDVAVAYPRRGVGVAASGDGLADALRQRHRPAVIPLDGPAVLALGAVEFVGEGVLLPEAGPPAVGVGGDGVSAGLVDPVDGLLDGETAGDLPVDAQGHDVPLLRRDLLRRDDYDLPVVLQLLVGQELVVVGDGYAAYALGHGGLHQLLHGGPAVLREACVDVQIGLHATSAPSVMSDSTVMTQPLPSPKTTTSSPSMTAATLSGAPSGSWMSFPRNFPSLTLATLIVTFSKCLTSILEEDTSMPQLTWVPLGTSQEGFRSRTLSPPSASSSAAMSMPSDLTPRNLAGFRLEMTSSFLPIIWS